MDTCLKSEFFCEEWSYDSIFGIFESSALSQVWINVQQIQRRTGRLLLVACQLINRYGVGLYGIARGNIINISLK